MDRAELTRLRDELRAKSIRGVTELHEHEQAWLAYTDAVLEYIDERVDAFKAEAR